jgi:2-oxoglutarate/2-oxoacid ferredoxin oxidoreductase subunit alpha
MDDKRVSSGKYFMMGNVACAEGAIAAGCEFAAGYPITPASEIAHTLAKRLPEVGGCFLQTEDEISAICAAIGASWTGKKVLVPTSGPGISLMLENIGFAVGVETPCVLINVQRGGPSTGAPTMGLQGDMVQPRRGSHGDYEIIALCPSSPQDMFDFVVRAFNLAERFRVPVFVMSDAFVGHMREEVIIPEAHRIERINRKIPERGADLNRINVFLDEDVAPMPIFGRGFKSHVTSSCHDEHGNRNLIDPTALDKFIRRLRNKILKHRDEIVQVEADYDGADLALVAYGAVARCAKEAVRIARSKGLPVGYLRIITAWPFPDRQIQDLAQKVKKILVLENNTGQYYPYVRAEAAGHAEVEFLAPEILGQVHGPDHVIGKIEEMLR